MLLIHGDYFVYWFLLLFESNNELNGSFVKLQSLEFGSALFRLRF
jgi:hypothetical protein